MALGLFWSSICLVVFISVLIYDRMGGFASKNKFPVDGRTIIITGGSQGMGRSVAKLLASKGANILIVARTVAPLQETVEILKKSALKPSQRFHYISADLTSPTEATRVISEATAWNHDQAPDIVWCCAGVARPSLFIESEVDTHREQMDSNYFTSAYIAHSVLRRWLSSPSSSSSSPPADSTPAHAKSKSKSTTTPEPKHLIFTSSVVAFYPLVGYSPYSPSKTALRALSDTLSQELHLYSAGSAVKVHTIFPATIFTQALEVENATKPAILKKLEESDGGQTPDEVAIASVKGLERGEELITTSGLMGYVMKVGNLGSSRRNGWGVVDTVASWVVAVVFGVVRWDMDRTVRRWGVEKGSRGGGKGE